MRRLTLSVITLIVLYFLCPVYADSCLSASSASCGTGPCMQFALINGTCSCKEGFYYFSENVCMPCASLGASDCSVKCPGFFYQTLNNLGVCHSCITTFGNCSTCNITGCSQCISGFQIAQNNSCINASSSCSISNCTLCSQTGGCYLCSEGFILNVQNLTCIMFNCTVSNCAVCSVSICNVCIEGFSLINGTCLPQCDPNCGNCSLGICLSCISQYILDQSNTSCSLNCSLGFDGNCVQCSSLFSCTICKAGYSPAYQGAVCQKIANCSVSNCKQCQNPSNCTACKVGYKLSSNASCIADICFITDCSDCSSASTCRHCSTNFALSSNYTLCIPACRSHISQCLVCNGSQACQVCNAGYKLTNNSCTRLCSISNCSVCLSTTTCLVCTPGYVPSSDGKSCQLLCQDPFCSTCSNSTHCTACIQEYNLSSSGKCTRNCMIGFAMNQNNTCQSCMYYLSSCQNCLFDSSNTVQCTKCLTGYYLSQGNCYLCSSISGCLSCKNSTTCSICRYGYKLSSSGTCSLRNCSVLNCQTCSNGTNSSCSSCSVGFLLNNLGNCIFSCTNGQMLINGACSCPPGTYQSQSGSSSCTSCSDSKCMNCTINSCSACRSGYYVSGATCVSCISNCLSCIDASSCFICQPPYMYSNGSCTSLGNGFNGVVDNSGNIFTCMPGCESCTLGTNNNIICTLVTSGYSQAGGKIIKCASQCKNCSDSNTCLSCYAGYSLSGGSCINCTDLYAISCSTTDASFSLSCVSGYTAVTDNSVQPSRSTCRACASNCYKCDINGAGTCDPGQCSIGYVQQKGNQNCTLCFNNCPSCDPTDLSNCLSCGIRRYKDQETGQCKSCPSGCQNCNSSRVCISCFYGFAMVGTLCQQGPVWPCVRGTHQTCTQCVQSFNLQNGTCVYNNNCNSTSNCASCPYGYYLTTVAASSYGNCFTCPKKTNCLTCDPSNIQNCMLCKNGYYVTSGSCASCPTGCSKCSSKYYCSQAQSGYYLLTNSDGSYNGQTAACISPCRTCQINPNFCLSCISGYVINGSMCFSAKAIYYSMVFNFASIFNSNDSYSVAYGKILRNIGYLKDTICKNLPKKVTQKDPNCTNNFNFLSFKPGSVGVDIVASGNGYQSNADAQNDMSSSNLIPGGQVLSSSTTTSGYSQSSQSESSSNLGMILGISISLGILSIVIIILIIIYVKRRKSNDFSEKVQTFGSKELQEVSEKSNEKE